MLGGHLHPDSPVDCPALSVTIIGRAKKLLRSHLAAAGDRLVLAVDLDGRAGCRSVVSWDANSGKSPEALRHRLEALPLVAESGAAFAAKDVSNAGILGTAAIMLENSGKGADIDLDAIPRPDSLTLEQWLLCFQSFGFILSVPPENIDQVFSIFSERGITAAVIGEVQEGTWLTFIRRLFGDAVRFQPGCHYRYQLLPGEAFLKTFRPWMLTCTKRMFPVQGSTFRVAG